MISQLHDFVVNYYWAILLKENETLKEASVKLHVTRRQIQRRKWFTYRLHCKLEPTEREEELLTKYGGLTESIQALPLTAQKLRIRGPMAVTVQDLIKQGQWWSSGHIYESFAEIPETIHNALQDTFATYRIRENWGGGDTDMEIIEIPTAVEAE